MQQLRFVDASSQPPHGTVQKLLKAFAAPSCMRNPLYSRSCCRNSGDGSYSVAEHVAYGLWVSQHCPRAQMTSASAWHHCLVAGMQQTSRPHRRAYLQHGHQWPVLWSNLPDVELAQVQEALT